MADQRITQLTALSEAGLAATDVLPIADISASETKKITAKDLIEGAIALADSGSVDLIKLNQSSVTKLGTTALADDAVTAAKLSNNSSVSIGTTAPVTDNFEGRGFYNSSTGVLQVYSSGSFSNVSATVGSGVVNTAQLVDGAVTTAKINAAGLGAAALASDSVITAKIADGAVTAAKIATDAITASQIATGAVGALELADNAVDTDAIVNLAVTTAKLGDGAVTEIKLGNLAVTNDKIANATIAYDKLNLADGSIPGTKIAANSVTADQIGALAVGTSELIASGVTTDKIADGAITAAKIAADSITTSQLAPNAVGASELADDAVDTAAIVDLAVTTAKLGDGSVTEIKLDNLAVTNDKIANTTIAYGKLNLADGSVPGAKIAANSITANEIGTSAVGVSQLGASSVTTDKIADGTITSVKIAPGAVGDSALASAAVTSSKIASGAVTYTAIQPTTTTNVVLGRSSAGGGTVEEITLTAAGRALIDDADATAQRSTLGLGDLATATGTWTNGSSFSGTSSGTNTGDQTITLTGDVTGTGAGSFAASIAASAVTEAKIATNAVTTSKINAAAVTAAKLADNSGVIVAADVPSGSGAFIGQQWINSNTGFEYTWTGSEWQRLHGISTITFPETTPLAFAVTYPDNFSAQISVSLDTQAANRVFIGPASGTDAAPTFRVLAPGDLPDATVSTKGIIQPGTGLSVTAGTLNHTNTVSGSTVNGITFDGQGHITAAVALTGSDIPGLDTSKITTGTFGTALLADNAVTSAKLADYSTAQIGEALPVADYIGQLFFNPLDKNVYLWDGNVWQPVGVSIGELILGGIYDASVNEVSSTTTAGAAAGLTAGDPLPTASSTFTSYYVVVSESGTGTAPAPTVALAPPDIILCDGGAWREIDVSSTYAAQSATNVAFVPAGTIGSTNVQTAVEEVANEAANASNLTSGVVAVARGGTALSSYTKGDLIAASGTTTLAKLAVGTNGQVLKANSATATGLEWGAAASGTVTDVTSSTGALTVATSTTTPALTIRSATTSVDGIVQLSDSTSTTSSVLAATSTAVKAAYDLANAALPKAGGVVTGVLEIGSTGSLVFEGATNDTFETTLAAADATADHTLTLPNATGNLVSTGDTNTVTGTMIADGTISNVEISATAEIAVSKLADGAARQLLQTDAAGTGVEWTNDIDIPGTLDVTGAATFDSTITTANNVTLNAQADLRFADADSSHWVAFQAPTIVATNVTWTLPAADGSPNQVLQTNGSGTLSWSTAAGNVGDVVLASNNAFTGANTFTNSTGQTFRQAATQDGILLRGRAGGTTSLAVEIIPTTLTANRVLTAPDVSGTIVTTADTGTVTSTMIADGTLTNGDINASAGIAFSKLASLTSGNILVGNASSVPTSVAMTGDVTISNAGVTAIGAGVIVNADINASAAIVDTKLATIATAGKVSNSATTATSANTASAIVARDGSGNFTAGTITTTGTIELGNASDTTLSRSAAGVLAVEGVVVPTVSSTNTLTNKTLTDPAIVGTILEDVFTITDGAAFEVDPGNGSVQLITLGASRTPKATNFAAGESITLMVNDGTAYTLTWTDATWGSGGVIWTGGAAPTLATTGYTVLQFWKVSTQVYGAYVGDVA